jgi:hypothetical protein
MLKTASWPIWRFLRARSLGARVRERLKTISHLVQIKLSVIIIIVKAAAR